MREKALEILQPEVYRGFGPSLAREYLAQKHSVKANRETVQQWMKTAGLWRTPRQRVEEVHLLRPRRSRCGELVQWDTRDHYWWEGREGVLDRDDRRRHQPSVRALCGQRLDGRKPADAVGLAGAIGPATGVLHRQSESV